MKCQKKLMQNNDTIIKKSAESLKKQKIMLLWDRIYFFHYSVGCFYKYFTLYLIIIEKEEKSNFSKSILRPLHDYLPLDADNDVAAYIAMFRKWNLKSLCSTWN